MQDDNEGSGSTTQLRNSNATIPRVQSDAFHERDLEIESMCASVGKQISTNIYSLLPGQVQSIGKHIVQADERVSDEPGSSIERLRNVFSSLRQALLVFFAKVPLLTYPSINVQTEIGFYNFIHFGPCTDC